MAYNPNSIDLFEMLDNDSGGGGGINLGIDGNISLLKIFSS